MFDKSSEGPTVHFLDRASRNLKKTSICMQIRVRIWHKASSYYILSKPTPDMSAYSPNYAALLKFDALK